MSGSATLGLEQQLLGHSLAFAPMVAPVQVWVALDLAPPAVSPSEAAPGTEVSGAGYTRMPATFALVATPANIAANTTSVEFPMAGSAWGTIGYFELWDSAIGGNRLYWGQLIDPMTELTTVVTVSAGNILRFSPGALGVQAATGSGGTSSVGAYLPLGGGQMQGSLLLAHDPTSTTEAATKAYVDAHSGTGGGAGFLPISGGSLTGALTLVGDAALPLQPVTLQQFSAGAGLFVTTTNPITGLPGMLPFHGDIYQSADAYALTGSMTVRGMPYGYYDTGTLLSVVATTGPLSSSRAGINGGFENGVSAIAGYGTFDAVNIYSGVRSEAPPLVLHSVTYDATHVYPQTPLTTAQMRALRVNMWVMTNSIDSTVSATPAVPNGRIPETHYASYVTGWAANGTSITVCGWTVPGSGHTATGQVPSATLDPGAANATAYFGSPTSMFSGNFVHQHNPGSVPDGRSRLYQGVEFDFQNFGTVDYQMYVAGLSLNYSSYPGLVQPTADSYGAKLSGFPTGVILRFNTVALNIDSTNTTAILTPPFNMYNETSPAPWSGSPVANLTWESMNYIDTNQFRLQCWTSRDTGAGSNGWPDASVHLGVRVDGTPQTMVGGSLLAQIVWSPQGYQSGLQIQNGAGVAGFSIDSTGSASLRGTATNNNAVAGNVGEYVSSTVVVGSAVPLTSGAAATVTSISLTPGDWDVIGNAGFQPAGTTTIAGIIAAINNSAALPGPAGSGYASVAAALTTGGQQVIAVASTRFSLAATTTMYLLAQATFGVSTMGAFGTIEARRRR